MISKFGNWVIAVVLMTWLGCVWLLTSQNRRFRCSPCLRASVVGVLFALCTLPAFAQGTLMQLPPLTTSLGTPIAGATINVFTTTGNLPSLVCAAPVTVYKDVALTLPFITLTTDGAGNYPFFISPSANPYGLTVSGAGTATSQCYGFSAPVPPLSSPTFLNETVTGTLNVTGLATFGNVLVGGTLGVTGAATLNSVNKTILADQQSGADACAKITTAYGLLPSTGGIVDATGFQGNQVCATGVTFPASKPITLKLGAFALIAGANTAITVPASGVVCIKGFGPTFGGSGNPSIITSTASTTTISWAGSRGCLENVEILNTVGDGLTLTASGTNSVSHNSFTNLYIASAGVINAGKIGLRLIANSATALVTENTFDSITIDDFDVSEQLETSGTQGPTDNYHFGWTYSGFAGAGTAGIKISSGDVNTWTHGFTSVRTTGVRLTAGSFNMFLGNRFETGATDVNDGGAGTILVGNSFNNCSTSTFDATATLVGSTGNTNCSFDLLPRGLTVGSQGLAINGSGSGKATIVTPPAAGTPTITTQTTSGTMAYTTQQNLVWGCTGTATSSQTLFMSNPGTVACTQTSATNPGEIGAVSGTLKNLAVNCGSAGKVAGSGVFTVDAAGSDTALTCTVGTGFACSDNSHTAAYTSPQMITIKYTTQATETLAGCSVSVQLQ